MTVAPIQAIVFSRDRALQLDAALRSFFRHVSDSRTAQFTVLYRASSQTHQSQYGELERELGARVHFVPEINFRRQLLEILSAGTSSLDLDPRRTWRGILRLTRTAEPQTAGIFPKFVLFLVDDDLFVRPFSLGAALAALAANADALGFSLRLGRNTTHCYVLDRQQSVPRFELLAGGILKWDWTAADGDFGYPLEVSSSLYALDTVRKLLKRPTFNDPNTLESQMFRQTRQFKRHLRALLCYERSVAFSIPLNRVQQVYENRAAGADKSSPEALAALFDGGKRIKVAALDGFVPSACHQEVELEFE